MDVSDSFQNILQGTEKIKGKMQWQYSSNYTILPYPFSGMQMGGRKRPPVHKAEALSAAIGTESELATSSESDRRAIVSPKFGRDMESNSRTAAMQGKTLV